MAMMIVKFHKMIQSKVLWYIILGVIVVSFVGFFTPTMGSKSGPAKNKTVIGELFGEKVTQPEFATMFRNMRLMYLLSTGQEPEMTEEFQEQVWRQLALLRKAAKEKVIVSNQEVRQRIQQMPAFMNQDGVFEKQRYDVLLGRLGVSKARVENMIREQIAIQKLVFSSVQSVLISPSELERAYHMYTDRLVVDYVVLTREQMAKEINVTDADAQAFYDVNMEMFRMPAKVRVSYVEFPVTNFLAEAEIEEGMALQLYNQNLEMYRVENEDPTAPVEYKAFGDVEEEINQKLLEYSARNLAIEQANSLVVAIAPKAQGAVPNFLGAVEAAGLTVQTLPAFGPNDELEGIDETSPFRKAALGLSDDADGSFSDAIVGKDSVYVISLEERYDSYIPPFGDVRKEAEEAAQARAVNEMLIARSRDIVGDVSAALAAGTDFAAAMEPYNLTVEKTEEFDLSSEVEIPYANQLIRACVSVQQGHLCEVIPVEEGMLIACVTQRTSQDSTTGLPMLRDTLIDGLTRERAQRMVTDWQESVMAEADRQIFDK